MSTFQVSDLSRDELYLVLVELKYSQARQCAKNFRGDSLNFIVSYGTMMKWCSEHSVLTKL